MHLVESYSSNTRLKIGKPKLYEQFYPVDAEKYIIIVSGTGMAGKNYRYFTDVLRFLKPYLEQNGIKIVQTGTDKENLITGVDIDLRNKTNIYQLNFLVQNSLMTLSGDTSIVHIAGAYNIPLVSLYGLTDPTISGSYFGDIGKQTYLEPDRTKFPSSFNPNDDSVNRITPETVAQACLKTLGIKNELNIKTVSTGVLYHTLTVETIPDMLLNPQILPGIIINIRGDYYFNEQNIYNQVHLRKSIIITKNPLNIDILKKLKENIYTIIVDVDENTDLKFIKALHNSGLGYNLISTLSEEALNKIKPIYFDYNVINRQDFPQKKEDVVNSSEFSDTTHFRSNRFVISEGKVYLSRAHWMDKIPCAGFEDNIGSVIDKKEFWEYSPYLWFFNQK